MITKLIFLFLLLILINVVNAETIGVGISPPRIYADNLLRGSHFEKEISLSKTVTNEDFIVAIDVDGQLSDWITVDKGSTFTFPKEIQAIPLVFSIDVPHNAAYGYYETKINVRIKPKQIIGGINTEIVLPIDVNITVADKEVVDYAIKYVRIPEVSQRSPIEIFLTVENKGNVKVKPSKVAVEITDKFRTSSLQTTDHKNLDYVEPFTKQEIKIKVSNRLLPEQYWANILVYDDEVLIKEDSVIFDIIEVAQSKIQKEILFVGMLSLIVLVLYHIRKRGYK